ncbi:MAG: DUF4328 domain-containing protein [Actinomycetia bacterium]|nr:DUF4328 domain-containing protein [Actinomycetes bacterium]
MTVGLYAVISLANIVLARSYLSALDDWERGTGSFDQLVAAEADHLSTAPLEMLLLLLAGLSTVIWFYRATKNTETLGLARLDHTPKWAIWGWVVPILSLFRPYQMMSQTWAASTSPTGTIYPTPRVQPWWWGLFLAGLVLDRIVTGATRTEWTPDNARVMLHVGSAAATADIIAAALFITLVRALTQRQLATIDELERPPGIPTPEPAPRDQ